MRRITIIFILILILIIACEKVPPEQDVPAKETPVEQEEKEQQQEKIDPIEQEQQECTTDNDCITGGCSGTICQSKDSEPIFTTCEYRKEYACYKEINCGCINGKCQWDKNEGFDRCVEEARAQPQNIIV